MLLHGLPKRLVGLPADRHGETPPRLPCCASKTPAVSAAPHRDRRTLHTSRLGLPPPSDTSGERRLPHVSSQALTSAGQHTAGRSTPRRNARASLLSAGYRYDG